jgi:hypothetical protein
MKEKKNAPRRITFPGNKSMYEIHIGAAANQGAAIYKPPF